MRRSVMGEGRVPAAQQTVVPTAAPAHSPQTPISGTIGTAVTRGTGRPLKHTARGELGLLLVTTVAQGKGRAISQPAARSTGVTIAPNAVWDPDMAIEQVAALDPRMEMKHRVARDLRVEANDAVVWHPGGTGLLIKGIACGPAAARTGSPLSSSKLCVVVPQNQTATQAAGLPTAAPIAWGEGRSIGQAAARSRGEPIEQAQTPTGGTIGTAAMRGTGRPLKHAATGGLGPPIATTVAWGKGRNISQRAAGSTGVPITGSTVRDPARAIKQKAASGPCMKMNPTVVQDHLHLKRPGTSAACLCSPSTQTEALLFNY